MLSSTAKFKRTLEEIDDGRSFVVLARFAALDVAHDLEKLVELDGARAIQVDGCI